MYEAFYFGVVLFTESLIL